MRAAEGVGPYMCRTAFAANDMHIFDLAANPIPKREGFA
jgi:hypothetical protein